MVTGAKQTRIIILCTYCFTDDAKPMAFQINAELRYDVPMRSTILLSIHALTTPNQKLQQEVFRVTPGVVWEELPMEAGETATSASTRAMSRRWKFPTP